VTHATAVTLTEDMRAVIQSASLCFVATVTPDGRANLSPKGTIRVWDDQRLYFLDIASPRTRENLGRNPSMEMNVVDLLSRRGYRFAGRASVHEPGSDIFADAMQRVFGDGPATYPVATVIVLEITHAAPLLSPAYWTTSGERELRDRWRARRAALDLQFDEHVARVGAVTVDHHDTQR